MKKLLFLLTILSLTSCYSYKNIDTKTAEQNFDVGKKYTLKIGKYDHPVKNLRKDGNYYVYTERKKDKTISVNEVESIREEKFSWEKTAGAVFGIFAILFGITAYSLNHMKILSP